MGKWTKCEQDAGKMGNPSDWEQLSSLLNLEDQVAAFVQNSLGSPSSTVELQLRMESGQAGASSLFPSIKSCLAHAADPTMSVLADETHLGQVPSAVTGWYWSTSTQRPKRPSPCPSSWGCNSSPKGL